MLAFGIAGDLRGIQSRTSRRQPGCCRRSYTACRNAGGPVILHPHTSQLERAGAQSVQLVGIDHCW